MCINTALSWARIALITASMALAPNPLSIKTDSATQAACCTLTLFGYLSIAVNASGVNQSHVRVIASGT
eukprot:COSAG01_NODE_54962_length_328_cov_1.139738_1_plen_68_part_10